MDSDINMKANEFRLTHYLRTLNEICMLADDDSWWLCTSFGSIVSLRFAHSAWHSDGKMRNYHRFTRVAIFHLQGNRISSKQQKELTENKNGNEMNCAHVGSFLIHLKLIASRSWWAKLLNCSETDPRARAIHIEFNRCVCCLSNLRLFTFRWSDMTR